MQHAGPEPARTRYGRCRVRSLLPLVLSDQAHHALASWIFVSRLTIPMICPDGSVTATVRLQCTCIAPLLRVRAPLIAARPRRGCLASMSIPAQRPARLVLDDARLEEVFFLLEVDHLRHPGEGVGRAGKQQVQANLLAAPVGDVTQILF